MWVFLTPVYMLSMQKCEHFLSRVCTCARVCAVCSLTFGDEGGEFHLVLKGDLLLVWGYLDIAEGELGVMSVSSLLLTGVGVHMITVTACEVLACEPSSRDETPRQHEKSRWTKIRHIFICICLQITHVYTYTGRRDEIWTNCFAFLKIISFRKRKAKDVNIIPRLQIKMDSSLSCIDPPWMVLDFGLKW